MTHFSKKRILLAGGGTGGPTSPLLAIAENLRKIDPLAELFFAGTGDFLEKSLAQGLELKFFKLPAIKFRRYFSFLNLLDLILLPYAILRAVFFILKYKINVVVGAGGFVSVPVAWAAKMFGRKILIHQQDVLPGLSNILCKNIASVATVSFEESKKDFPDAIVTGNPVREAIVNGNKERGLATFGFSSDRPIVLIFGGGSGAKALNELTEKALFMLLDGDVQVLHLAGRNAPKPPAFLDKGGYVRRDFLTDMADAYAISDAVVCRAGMSSIAELSMLGKPAIIIPMPNSHQVKNAEMLKKKNAAIVLDQKQLSAGNYAEEILNILKNFEKRKEIAKNISNVMKHNAAEEISELVYKLAQ